MENHPNHPLAIWIRNHPKFSQTTFCNYAGCSESHLSLIIQGKRGVSMKMAKRLSDATAGEVPIASFLMAEAAQ
jgi:hypothetical protein